MNLFFMGLMYPKENYYQISQNCKTGMQNQLDNFQKLILTGLYSNKLIDNISICNCPPVGIYPKHYKKIYIPDFEIENGFSMACINLPYIKQVMREKTSFDMLLAWLNASDKNRHVLIYSMYLPYLKAACKAKQIFKDMHISLIVPDLPADLGLASGRSGILSHIEKKRAILALNLCKNVDSFVLLTEHMLEKIPHKDSAKFTVLEGIAKEDSELLDESLSLSLFEKLGVDKASKKVVYTGTMQKELNIDKLILAFGQDELKDYKLILCGNGKDYKELMDIAKGLSNVYFTGYVPRQDAIIYQSGADLLINPRTPDGLYTRYSFPSKTMEYMLSARPTLCYKLDGIPDEYDPYLNYVDTTLSEAIHKLLGSSNESLKEKANAARWFVLREKNPLVQSAKIVDLLME